MKKLFGTDGIRGVANSELTPELAFRMGRIVASLLGSRSCTGQPFFWLGRDTRISGTMLEGALVAGITSAGMQARLLGVVSTPAVAYLTVALKAAGGVMISASHNPAGDNGIKFFDANGYKLSLELEAKAEELFYGNADDLPRPGGEGVGRAVRSGKALQHYLTFLKKEAPGLKGLKVVLDCANGSLWKIAPRVYRELGADVISLHSSPNGTNINVKCGSTNPDLLQKAVRKHGANLGLAFDGDGDRLIAVDEKGELVDGDAVMAICASYLVEKDMLPGRKIVATVMSNGGLDIAGEEHGFEVIRTQVGDRFVLEEMLRSGCVLGGEQSGHIIFAGSMTTGDGLFTSLQLLKVMVEKGDPLSCLSSIIRPLPQLLVNCRIKNKDGWENNERIAESIKLAQKKLGNRGRVLVRPSGTEPLIRIMVEGEKSTLLQEISRSLAAVVEKELGISS
jgi:phosphoglucosamine mutase